MLPWLWHRLEERSIHGLEWVARDQFMFRMPWVHAKKKSYDVSRDAALYKQWAINSGKYVAHRDIADPTTWKINFRCALNSLKGHIDCLRVDEIDGFRYYQFNKQALHEQLEADQNRLYRKSVTSPRDEIYNATFPGFLFFSIRTPQFRLVARRISSLARVDAGTDAVAGKNGEEGVFCRVLPALGAREIAALLRLRMTEYRSFIAYVAFRTPGTDDVSRAHVSTAATATDEPVRFER